MLSPGLFQKQQAVSPGKIDPVPPTPKLNVCTEQKIILLQAVAHFPCAPAHHGFPTDGREGLPAQGCNLSGIQEHRADWNGRSFCVRGAEYPRQAEYRAMGRVREERQHNWYHGYVVLRNSTIEGKMTRLLTVLLSAAMGGTYEFVKTASANLREKEDHWNVALGGFFSGSLLGLRGSFFMNS